MRAFALCSGARWIERQHGRTGGASIVSACVGCAVGDIVKVHHKARCFGCTEQGKARQGKAMRQCDRVGPTECCAAANAHGFAPRLAAKQGGGTPACSALVRRAGVIHIAHRRKFHSCTARSRHRRRAALGGCRRRARSCGQARKALMRPNLSDWPMAAYRGATACRAAQRKRQWRAVCRVEAAAMPPPNERTTWHSATVGGGRQVGLPCLSPHCVAPTESRCHEVASDAAG